MQQPASVEAVHDPQQEAGAQPPVEPAAVAQAEAEEEQQAAAQQQQQLEKSSVQAVVSGVEPHVEAKPEQATDVVVEKEDVPTGGGAEVEKENEKEFDGDLELVDSNAGADETDEGEEGKGQPACTQHMAAHV